MNTLLTDPQAASLILADENYEIQSTSTYLLARDEDCENSFHSTADFVSTPAYILFCSLLFYSVLSFISVDLLSPSNFFYLVVLSPLSCHIYLFISCFYSILFSD